MTPPRPDPPEPHPRFPAPAAPVAPRTPARPAGVTATVPTAAVPRWPLPKRTLFRTPRAWLAALLAGTVALAAYVWGAAPTVLPGDAAELATVALKGGVAHTPGYPTYVLLGHVAGALLPGEPAYRITLLSAVMGAVSVGLFAMVLAEFALSFGAVLAGALGFAAMFTLWWSAIRTEVYTTGLALAVFALWRVLVARRTLQPLAGLAAAFAIGLAMTVHLSFGLLLAIAGVMLAVRAARARKLSPLLAVGALLALAAGLAPYAYLPWADAHFTLTNHLKTAVEPTGGQYGLTPEAFDTPLERLRWLIAGPESHPRALAGHLPTAFVNLLVAGARFALFDAGPVVLLLGLLGMPRLLQRDRGAMLLLIAGGVLTPLLAAVAVDGALLNVFMLTTSLAAAALAAGAYDRIAAGRGGSGVMALLVMLVAAAVPHELRVRADESPFLGRSWLTMPVEGPPPVRTRVPSFRGETRARDEARRILRALPDSSFVAARWDRVTVLKYLQSAEGVRPDVWLDPWYEPSHIVRIARWQREHLLESHPVVVVDTIAGLRDRLLAPQTRHLPGGIVLEIEREWVDTTLVR